MPRLPAAGAGRKADPIIIFSFPGSPALWAGSFTDEIGIKWNVCFSGQGA